ncbi:hypothetical protein EIP86_005275 [Pleurotus ostreatoroseus]|nr:hypothetical protein EIP86_005275 [Pleurotus ostreatoroseus]
MSFVNHYKPPTPKQYTEDELYGPEPYDVNFVFPLPLEGLETERVKLTPFIPRLHAEQYWENGGNDPSLFRYYPYTLDSLDSFLANLETSIRRDPANVVFVIIDKTRPDPAHPELGGSFAGIIGLFYSSEAKLTTEIAFVLIFRAFQRTHVASNAVGALLRYCLEVPAASPPGLGLRRVQWCAHSRNLASARLAERMGFKREGIIRWHWVLSEHLARDGNMPRKTDRWPEKPGRDTVLLSLCWDDWEGGAKEVAEKEMNRTK